MEKNFWKDWKRKTKLEEKGIRTIEKVKHLILRNFPREEIVAIYVKGSFVRRELNEASDVDFEVILKHSKFLPKVKRLVNEYKSQFEMRINIGRLSIWELKNNKHAGISEKLRSSPYTFLRQIKRYKLIFGKEVDPNIYPEKDNKRYLENRIKTFRNVFIPYLKEKKLGFQDIIKQVFWLVESEERAHGRNPPHSWKKLAKSIKDKNHIVHDTLRYRLHPTKDKKLRSAYIKKLERHLNRLEKMIKQSNHN